MKQQALMRSVHCPVNCPVCHYAGAGFPAYFRRIALSASEIIDRITNQSNHLLFLLEGTIHVCLEGDSIRLQAGQCLFFSRNMRPEVMAIQPSDIVWLDFSNRIILGKHDVLTGVASKCDREDNQAFFVLEMNDAMRSALIRMHPVDSPCRHLLWQYELYMILADGYTVGELAHFFRPILRASDDFRAFVINNYLVKDSLDDIARKANLSKSYFFQRFKRTFGISAHQWQVKQKQRGLLQAIASGITDSKRLADEFGFKSKEGFYLFCRRHFGCSFTELKARAGKIEAKMTSEEHE